MPNDTRIAFYRAHTLWAMHRFQDAYSAYDVRLNMANVSRSNPVNIWPLTCPALRPDTRALTRLRPLLSCPARRPYVAAEIRTAASL